VEQPAMRDYLGHTLISMRDNIAYEAALGDRGRSGEQFDIWQAVYSPTAEDGYPQPIFDKRTGAIDHKRPSTGASTTTWTPYCNAIGPRSGRSCRASCTSTSARTTPIS
jgi:hypothetical protein